jgi:hypothetical protein
MKLKLKEIIAAQSSLRELLNQPLPVKLSYTLSKTVKKIDSEFRQLDEATTGLKKKYGHEKTKGSEEFMIPVEDKEATKSYKSEFDELLEVEVEIPNYEPISISEFENLDIKISPVHLSNLVGTILKE